MICPNVVGTLRVGCQKLTEFAPLFGRTCGAILFRAEVWEVIRAEGPAVHPAKGAALVCRSHRVLFSALPYALRPNGPRVRLNSPTVCVGLQMNSWHVGPDVTGKKRELGGAAVPGLRPSLGEPPPLRGSHPPPRARNRNRNHELNQGQRLFSRPHGVCLLQFVQLIFAR
jgi:hypothetical protein